MRFSLAKILTLLISFIFLTGFIPIFSLIGPGLTAITSGNIYKASAQFIIDQSIKQKTGKNSLMLVKEGIEKKNQQSKFNEELRKLVEKRVKMTREKLNLDNIIQ
tara:strand:+ start:1807 stop:2121 length:315 start_codon:yes stop_codon:yes gene_type:complete